jgi:hypothetical protein
MATQPQNPKDAEGARPTVAPTFQYIDRPDVLETFADSIEGTFFDGQTLRIEFCVNRLDPLKPNTPPTGRRYPACRLVLTPAAAVELMNRMRQTASIPTSASHTRTTWIVTPRRGQPDTRRS